MSSRSKLAIIQVGEYNVEMRRLIWRILKFTSPAILLLAIWLGWWTFGDRPIRTFPKDPKWFGLFHRGVRHTWIETNGQVSIHKPEFRWFESDSFRDLVDPSKLKDCWVHLSDDEQSLIVAKVGEPLRLFDRNTGQDRANESLPVVGDRSCVGVGLGGNLVAYPLENKSVAVVDVRRAVVIQQFADSVGPVGLSESGQFLLTGIGSDNWIVRDRADGSEKGRINCDRAANRIVMSDSGERVVVEVGEKLTDCYVYSLLSKDNVSLNALAMHHASSWRIAKNLLVPENNGGSSAVFDLSIWPLQIKTDLTGEEIVVASVSPLQTWWANISFTTSTWKMSRELAGAAEVEVKLGEWGDRFRDMVVAVGW